MKQEQDQDFQESLDFLRGRFDELNPDIKLPHSLDAGVLREKLDHLDALPFPDTRPKRNRTLQVVLSFAACFVIVFGVYYLTRGMGTASLESPQSSSSAASSEDIQDAMPFVAMDSPENAPVPMIVNDEQLDQPVYSPEEAEAQPFSAEGGTQEELDSPLPGAMPRSAMIPTEEDGTVLQSSPASNKMLTQAEAITTQEEARAVPEWGAYIPLQMPDGVTFDVAYNNGDSLFAAYSKKETSKGIGITISTFTDEQKAYLVDPAKPETYDLHLYDPPYYESLPEGIWVINQPIFKAADVNESVLQARILPADELGNPSMAQFSVLYPAKNIVVYYNVTDFSANEMDQLVKNTKEP